MSKKVNILSLVSYKFLPPDMGGQKGVAFFNRYLSKENVLTCVTVKANSNHTEEGYTVKNILSDSPSRYFNLLYFFKLRHIISEEKITHLIIEHPYYGWLGLLLKWLCHIKLVVHSHNIESLRFKSVGKWWWGILWYYERFVHQKAHFSFFIHDNDRDYAIRNFRLDPSKCTIITYGFDLERPPSSAEKKSARELVCKAQGINPADRLLLFNGTLGYKPNLDALNIILEKINPVLLAHKDFKYKIIICGSKLPPEYDNLANYKDQNIIYAGFVEDINQYFKGCDIFINPVIDGGGIKTKVVEALGNDLSVISTLSGATGIPAEITGGKLLVLPDDDWSKFAHSIMESEPGNVIPPSYFNYFFWANIAKKASAAISGL